MRAIDIIEKKRDRQELSKEEIQFFVNGFAGDEIPDYQAAAWAMAVLLNGMTPSETADLTLAMAASGEILDLSSVPATTVDKHSTGGVGDKTSLVVGPMVAACGLAVGKMSGHGLGFTGGTLDKMESIPGYRTDLSTAEFMEQLRTVGFVLTGQTADLAPADGKLYALRDVTGTVPAIPLIASSIMSKKIAAGARAIVLDVKVGKGAFMESLESARQLAELMVSIARHADRQAIALLSDMNQPLGQAVGNALEVREAIQTLRGEGPADFIEHCLVVAAHMLALGGVAANEGLGREMAEEVLRTGKAYERFISLVRAQGGDTAYVEEPDRLPHAPVKEVVPSPHSAHLTGVHARVVGETAVLLGAGRAKKGDTIDHGVGVEIYHKVGERVEDGQPLFAVHARSQGDLDRVRQMLLEAHTWSEHPVDPLPLFYDVIH
jgi:pyrimidine-nucleoside phosphorylase